MLEVGDEHEPVVDPEVRKNVKDEHLGDGALVSPVAETGHDGGDTDVREDDVEVVPGLEDDRLWVEVVGSGGVRRLSTGVHDQVSGPSEDLSDEKVEADHNRRVLNSLSELLLTELGNVDTKDLVLVGGAETDLASGLWDEDFVAGKVTGGGVVTTVGDPPRVVRDKQHGVDDETNGVVDLLGRGVGLVTALVTWRQRGCLCVATPKLTQ